MLTLLARRYKVSYINFLDLVYPIDSIYISFSSTSPAEIIGGVWEQIEGKFLRADTNVEIGGEDEHVLIINEMPSHNHSNPANTNNHRYLNPVGWNSSAVIIGYQGGDRSNFASSNQSVPSAYPQGANAAHNNMPVYQNCYMWRRIL